MRIPSTAGAQDAERSRFCRGSLAALPGMVALKPAQCALRRMSLLPDTGGVFIRLGPGRVRVNRAENLVEANLVTHGQDEFSEQFAGVLADDRGTEDAILARRRQDLDKPKR